MHILFILYQKHAPNRMRKRRTINPHLPKCSCKMRNLFFKNKMMHEKPTTKSSLPMHRAIYQTYHYLGGVLVNPFNTSPVF